MVDGEIRLLGTQTEIERRYEDLIGGARSESTKATHERGWRNWATWRALQGKQPFLSWGDRDGRNEEEEAKDRLQQELASALGRVLGPGGQRPQGRRRGAPSARTRAFSSGPSRAAAPLPLCVCEATGEATDVATGVATGVATDVATDAAARRWRAKRTARRCGRAPG